jgi:hypothetical protein
MRPTFVALALALALVHSQGSALAQSASKTARGTVTAMSADSVTVKVATVDMTFTVDSKTNVIAAGGSTKERAAQAAGAPGPKLADVIKVGQPVSVRYRDVGTTHHASSITAVNSAGSDPAATKTSNGTVDAVSATSMTISGSTGPAKFNQTFTIDNDTKVVGKGVGTATKGAKVAITDLVGKGDQVSVSYHMTGTTLRASEVRVTTKAAK